MIKVALYVRVSRKDQTYERQVSELTEYARSMNYNVVGIVSEKLSGSKTSLDNRPGVQELFNLASSGKISKVLISEVSRLGRRTKDLLEIIEQLHDHKVSLVVYNYRLETLDHRGKVNSMAQFLITLLGDIARMETETLSERTISGLDEAKRKGKKLGRPAGYIKSNIRIVKENPVIAKKLNEGLSIRDIAKICGCGTAKVQKVKKALSI